MDEEFGIQDPHYVAVWQRVQAAFTNSQLDPSFHAALTGMAFGVAMSEAVKTLGSEHKGTVQRANQLSFDSLAAAREGNTDIASVLLNEAGTALERIPGSERGREFGASAFHAARAYLSYKQGQFDLAENDLARSNLADLKLLEAAAFMHVHRIQLVHNLARVEVRRGRKEVGVRLLNRLVRHLSGQRVEICEFSGPWSRYQSDSCDPDLLAAMLCQVLRDLRTWAQPSSPFCVGEALPA